MSERQNRIMAILAEKLGAAEARVKELEAALRGLLAIAERNEDGDAVDRARAALVEASISDALTRFPKTLARLGSRGDKT